MVLDSEYKSVDAVEVRDALQSNKLTKFFSGRSCFSNFYPCRVLEIDGADWRCTEHYYMYQKATAFGDSYTAARILQSQKPAQMKYWGRRVCGFKQDKWDAISRDIMRKACKCKFEQNRQLLIELFRTCGTVLVEASPYDRRWGIGLSATDKRSNDFKSWQGENWLGFLLSNLREELCSRPQFVPLFECVKCDRSFNYPVGILG